MKRVHKESELETLRKGVSCVAYVSTDPGVPAFGSKGASVHVQAILAALLRQNVRVKLFSSSVEGTPPLGLRDVEVHRLTNWPKGNLSGVESAVETSNESLRSALEHNQPFDFIYERYALWGYAGMEFAQSKGVPGVLEVNSPLIEEEEKYRQLTNRALAKRVARRAFRACDRILAVSNGVAEYLASFTETTGKVKVVRNGVDPFRFPDRMEPSRPAPPGTFTVGFVGSLKPWHGLDTLAEAYRIFHGKGGRSRLLVVGDGPQRKDFEMLLTEKGLSGVCEFSGSVYPSEVPGLIASMDVGVAPYPPLEGFYFSPLKIFEYMAAGKPTVASRVGDISEIMHDGVDGILVPPADPERLAEALVSLRTHPGLRVSMGSAARENVLRSHTWDIIAAEIFNLVRMTDAKRQQAR